MGKVSKQHWTMNGQFFFHCFFRAWKLHGIKWKKVSTGVQMTEHQEKASCLVQRARKWPSEDHRRREFTGYTQRPQGPEFCGGETSFSLAKLWSQMAGRNTLAFCSDSSPWARMRVHSLKCAEGPVTKAIFLGEKSGRGNPTELESTRKTAEGKVCGKITPQIV